MINDRYYYRQYVIGGLVVVVLLLYTFRLFHLQVIDRAGQQKAVSNALIQQPIYPSRGLIYDRNGKLLVFNQPIYEITLITNEMKNGFDTLAFCETLGFEKSDFIERMKDIRDRKKNKGFSKYTPQVFVGQLSKEDIAPIQEKLYRFPGVGLRKRSLRDYTYQAAAHVLGSVGEITQRDLERDFYYQRGDYAGREGIERTYETVLRGEKGIEVLMRDAVGKIQGSYKDGELDKAPQAGTNLTLTLDIDLQIVAEQLLQNKVGSVVAIEPSTGEILAMASSPNWDPKMLVGKERSANYTALLQDPAKPLINRATMATYSPGSTFKLIQALVELQGKAITKNTFYPCSGPESVPIKCTHHHGSPVSLEEAIEQSCNPYFWYSFQNLLQKDGLGKDNELMRQQYALWRDNVCSFGFGSKFQHTDIGDQTSGNVPTMAYFDKIYGKKGWKAITIRSLSIGQGEILVNPMQLCNEAAIIANKGFYITPHLNRIDSMKSDIHTCNVDPKYFDVVQSGMHRVMTNGTGRWYNVDSLQICGKTGTVQNPHGEDHAIFIGFAPMESPKIAVAVVVENAGFGATRAAPIASLVIEQYLMGTITRTNLFETIRQTNLMNGKESTP